MTLNVTLRGIIALSKISRAGLRIAADALRRELWMPSLAIAKISASGGVSD